MCVCVYKCMCAHARVHVSTHTHQKKALVLKLKLQMVVSRSTRVLETELGSSVRAGGFFTTQTSLWPLRKYFDKLTGAGGRWIVKPKRQLIYPAVKIVGVCARGTAEKKNRGGQREARQVDKNPS